MRAILGVMCKFGMFLAIPASANTIQVFLQGGQSNCVGNAPASGLPTALQSPQTDVKFYFGISATQSGVSLKSSALTWVDLQPGTGYDIGPEILFGRTMADALTSASNQIAIIKYGHGGTGFITGAANVWYGGGDATTTGDGNAYQVFQSTVASGLSALATANPDKTIQIAGMIWIQGEADAQSEPDDYQTDLTAFFADIRATYGANLPIVLTQLSNNQTSIQTAGLATVKAAQAAIAAADPFIEMVVSDSYTVKTDNIHFDTNSQISMGTELANRMLDLLTLNSYLLKVDTVAPSTDVIVSSSASGTYTRCFDPADQANHYRGQSFLMPDTGDSLSTQWSVDAITIQKHTAQTFAGDSSFKLWVFEWNPATDSDNMSNWEGFGDGDADGDIFDGTGSTNILIDGDADLIGTTTISADAYVTFDFTEPLVLDENKAYGFLIQYLKGSSGQTYFQIAVNAGNAYSNGQLLQVTTAANSGVDSQDLVFYIQGSAISNCLYPPLADISGPNSQKDCKVDIYDFAAIAAGWLDCGFEPIGLCNQ